MTKLFKSNNTEFNYLIPAQLILSSENNRENQEANDEFYGNASSAHTLTTTDHDVKNVNDKISGKMWKYIFSITVIVIC